MGFDAGVSQKRFGILDRIGLNVGLLEGFKLPAGKIERFGDFDGFVSVVAGN